MRVILPARFGSGSCSDEAHHAGIIVTSIGRHSLVNINFCCLPDAPPSQSLPWLSDIPNSNERYKVKVALFPSRDFQPRVAEHDPIPSDAIVAVGGCQGQETVLWVNRNRNLKHAPGTIDRSSLETRLAVDQHPNVGTHVLALPRDFLPVACHARNRTSLQPRFACRIASRSKVTPLLACRNSRPWPGEA